MVLVVGSGLVDSSDQVHVCEWLHNESLWCLACILGVLLDDDGDDLLDVRLARLFGHLLGRVVDLVFGLGGGSLSGVVINDIHLRGGFIKD